MSLTPGTRLGVYEITDQIGEGGMGQVYRATDTALGRPVAIKILPEAFAADAERVARFEREAKTLASLNHPNIAAIYAIEKSTGQHALVMELVEGEDLSQRIARGAIPVDEALPIATQIAEALEAAHEQGIVHRDLKPANIKVRPDGAVKVLDFGLAKAMESGSGAGDRGLVHASQLPTITTPALMTGAGVILGTAAYMSPEQAKGRPVDRRADIWAFGCVLFEMLTGRRAFGGDDVQDTFVAIMRDEPDWSRLPSSTSLSMRRLLRRCLDKDQKRRLRDIGEARLALEGAFETADGDTGSAVWDPAYVLRETAAAHTDAAVATARAEATGIMRRRGRLVWMAFGVAVLGMIAFAIPALRHLRETPLPAPPETRVDIVTPETTEPTSFALSPDGRQIVFVASGEGASRLWLRPLDQTTAQPLVGTEGATYPFWSPDGRSVGFFDGSSLKRLDLAGGPPQTLAPAANRGGAWSAEGVILFTPTTGSPLVRIPASGGAAVAATTLATQTSHRFPQFLPGGRRFVRGGTLLAQRLDLTRRALTGDPVTVADPVAVDGTSFAGAVSVSAAGLVAYRSGRASRRQLTWFDRAGTALGTVGVPDENALLTPRLSPDGRRVAVARAVQGNTDIWLLDADRMTRFTFDASPDRFPIWSPDGSRIVFDSPRTGHRDLYEKPSNGAGNEALLVAASPQDKAANDWSADGRFLLYGSLDSQTSWDIWAVPLDGDRTPVVWLKTPFDERRGQFSPDGRWVAYTSNESGRFEIHVRPFAGPSAPGGAEGRGGGQWQVSTAGGTSARWGPGGKELYYVAPDGTLMAAPMTVTGATLEPGRPVALFRTRIVGGGTDLNLGANYDIARDGRILINTVLDEAAAPITLIQHWRSDTTR